uniref:Ig-like domain-containing protein n=1 Tax=Stomoxys calcitrans TaxID=35570 RepID=A0A1I8PG55_STOCA
MNLAFDTRIFILVCCLLQGLAGLRLIKVSIPAYKLRGESAFMECQYELNKSKGIFGGAHTHRSRNHHGGYGGAYHHQQHQQQQQQHRQHIATTGLNMNYEDSEDMPEYRRSMQHTQQRQYPQQTHRQPYFQPQIQTQAHKVASWHDTGSSAVASASMSSSSSSSSSRSNPGIATSYYQQSKQQYPYVQQKQKRQYNPEYPTLPPSPYGHSVYRGRTQTSSTSLSSSLAASSSATGHSNTNHGGRVGASTYTGKTTSYSNTGGYGSIISSNSNYGRQSQHEREDSFGDSNERHSEHLNHMNGGRGRLHDDDDDDENSHEEDDSDNEAEDDDDQEEEGEDLYAIKWYKDNEEFYRYVPKANPPKTSYRVDGVRVIEEHSDSSRVLLRGLTINSTGLYRCEISAEAPNFSSVQGEGRMDVVYLPRDGPHIKGQQFQYQIGEILNLNCTSGKSHPASHLQWFINDQAVVDGQYLVRYNDTVHRHGLITSTLGLEMTVDARHFHNGAMRVKCLASISPVLWKGGKESVLQRRPGIIDNREAMLLVRSSTMGLHHRSGHNTALMVLRLLTTTAVLMKLCQLLHLHTGLT